MTYFNKGGKDWISLRTYRQNGYSPGAIALGIKDTDIKKNYHNHTPENIYNETYTERYSMGDSNPIDGDYLKVTKNNLTYPNYVYFPKSTNLYNVTQTGVNYIQKFNNDYQRLKK